jgi:predicted MFS family arabinose efflux permease
MSRQPLRSLLTANTISTIGTTMTFLAIPWYVLQTTGSASKTGIAAASETIPLALAAGLGGPVVDRLGARRVSVVSDVISALAIAAIPALHNTLGLSFWQLCLLIGVVGFARGPGDMSRHVLVPGLATLGGTPLERATSMYDGVSRGARMLGAPLAGVLIAVWGASDILLIDAVTFAASAVLVQLLVPGSVRPAMASEPEPYIGQLRTGLRYLRTDRLIGGITAMVMVTNLLDAAYSSVLVPVYARDVLHSSVALGLLGGVFGGGALAGTLVYGVIGPRLPRWPVYTVAFLVVGGPRFFLLGAEPPMAVILAGVLFAGLLCGAINPVLSAVEFQRIPDAMQSRVFGATSAGCLIGMPVGAVGGGLAIDAFGIRAALIGTGALYLLTTLAPVVFPVWREMDAGRDVRRRPQPQKNAVAQIP